MMKLYLICLQWTRTFFTWLLGCHAHPGFRPTSLAAPPRPLPQFLPAAHPTPDPASLVTWSVQELPSYVHSQSLKQASRLLALSTTNMGSPGGSDGKECSCDAGDPLLSPGLGRSPGEESGYPLQYSCLDNSMDRAAWLATVHRVAKRWTYWAINVFTSFFFFICPRLSDSYFHCR